MLLGLGVLWHGFSLEVQQRFWSDIFERAGGVMSFRFFLQPAMALLAALPDGINDDAARRNVAGAVLTRRLQTGAVYVSGDLSARGVRA